MERKIDSFTRYNFKKARILIVHDLDGREDDNKKCYPPPPPGRPIPPFHGNKARVGRGQVSSYIEALGLII